MAADECRSGARVLVVDDEPGLRALLAIYLSRLGYEVSACGTAAEAELAFGVPNAPFALVIADMHLPDLHGYELIRRLAARNPSIRVLVCSGAAPEPHALPPVPEGRIGFLPKPFQPLELQAAIDGLLTADA